MRESLYILGLLADTDVDWLASAGRRTPIPRGTKLVTQGEPTDALYLILDGRFAVSIAPGDGRAPARVVRELGAGEVVGEISLLESRPPSGSVTAVSDSTVLAIPRRDLESHLNNDAPFASRFYKALAVFLAQRLRTVGASPGADRAAADEADELDPAVLEQVGLAAARFRWIVDRLSQTHH